MHKVHIIYYSIRILYTLYTTVYIYYTQYILPSVTDLRKRIFGDFLFLFDLHLGQRDINVLLQDLDPFMDGIGETSQRV